jgi:hypothetical protein
MSVVNDIMVHLENCGVGSIGVDILSYAETLMKKMESMTIMVKEDPTYNIPDSSVDIDYHRIRIVVLGTIGNKGYERGWELAEECYKACKAQRDITLNGTLYSSILAFQPPYDSDVDTENGIIGFTTLIDVTRYTQGYNEYQYNNA